MKVRNANHQLNLIRLYLATISFYLLGHNTGVGFFKALALIGAIAVVSEIITFDFFKRWNGRD